MTQQTCRRSRSPKGGQNLVVPWKCAIQKCAVTTENADFLQERDFFSRYREGLLRDTTLSGEVSTAIRVVLDRYNTTVWENRFIVGGVVEQIIGASARELGLVVANAGKQNQGYDLELDKTRDLGISIKGIFASTGGMHNLVNFRSSGESEDLRSRWSRATIFVMSDVGVGYIDPQMGSEFLHQTADALQISGKKLKAWWDEHPEWLVSVAIPKKSNLEATRVASDAVSWDIFNDFSRLRKNWQPEI